MNATDLHLPVSADLENGFGDAPEPVAETVRRAAEAGLVGCTIEDTTGNTAQPLYDFALAVERIAAGGAAARALGFPFLLTARTHNLLFPGGHLDETVRRLQALKKSRSRHTLRAGSARTGGGADDMRFADQALQFHGRHPWQIFLRCRTRRRISLATSPYRAAMTAFLAAAREVQDHGTFTFLERSLKSTGEIVSVMET